MLVAVMLCSDPVCAEVVELWGEPGELEALEAVLCDCGCALQTIALCEGDEALARVLPLPLAA